MTIVTNGQTLPADHRAAAVDVGRQGGHFQQRMGGQNAQGQQADHADLHVRAEIAPRGQQHPHRQDGHDRRVDRQDDDNCLSLNTSSVRQSGVVKRLAEDHAEEDEGHADQRGLADAARGGSCTSRSP